MPNPKTESLGRLTKLLYGMGDTGFSLNNSTIGILFGIFLMDVVGLDAGLAAAAVFIGRSWDWINDPLIGYLSDRTRTRWGRRRPFLLFGFIPFGLAFTMLWWKPPIHALQLPVDDQVGLAVYYAIAYIVYEIAATLVYMPYYALTPELTQDYDERTTLTSYRMIFSILGGLIAFTVPLAIIGAMRPENAGRVFMTGSLIATISATPLFLTFLGTRERPEYQAQAQPRLRESLAAASRNRPFLFAAGVFLFTWAALEIVQAMLLFFIKYRLKMEAQNNLIAGTIFITALLTLPLWERASRRWDKRTAYIAGMAFLSTVMVVLIAVSPAWGLPVVLGLAILAGIGVGAMHVLPWSMIPDAVEWDELATGRRHEGVFYSLTTLMRKIAASIALPLTLIVLDASGYIANAPTQTPGAVLAIQILTGPVPAVLLCTGILFALFYPLGRARHAQVRVELAARKAMAPPRQADEKERTANIPG